MLKVDLHIHAKEDKYDRITYSEKELIDKAAELKFDVLSFTFHNRLFWEDKVRDYAKKKGILLIPGTEMIIEGSEVLIYNIRNDDLKTLKTFNDLRKLRNKQNDIFVIAPHPFYKTKFCLENSLEKHIDVFDAIEYSWFFSKLINFNRKSLKISKKYNKPLIATSDVHYIEKFGKNYSLIDSAKDIESIFNAIKNNRVNIKSKPIPLLIFLAFSLKIIFHHGLLNNDR